MVKYAVIGLFSATFIVAVWAHGYSSGVQSAQIAQLKAAIKSEKDREDVDKDVASRSAYDLCISVGGMPDECAELRGVEEAPNSD